MRILLIGGTGTISTAITALLAKRGTDRVWVLNRGNRANSLPEGVGQIVADAYDKDSFSKAVDGLEFDVAGYFIGFDVKQVAIAHDVLSGKVKQFIYISSASAYEKPPKNWLITEDTPLVNPFWEYSRKKAECEKYLMDRYSSEGFPVTIVRPSHTYCERSTPVGMHGSKGSWAVLKRMIDGKPVIVHGDGTSLWTMTDSRDFAKAFVGLFGKEQALPLLRTAYEGSPDDYWLRYAVTAYETGHKSTAMQVLKTMRKRNPKDIDVLELYEHIYLKEGKLKQALASRDAIDKLTGEATEQSVITRFNILREAGKRAEAFRVLDNYLQRDPNNGRIRAIRQEHAYSEATAKGNAAEARELLNQLLDNADIPLQRKIYYVTNCKERAGYTPADIRAMLSELREQYPYEQQIYQAMFDFEQNDMHNPTGALEIGRTMLTMNPTDATLREQIANLMRDDSTVTVTRVCKRNESHVQTETFTPAAS